MSDDTEVPEEEEEEGDVEGFYDPQPIVLVEGDVIILDPEDFGQTTNSIAVRYAGAKMEVLRRDSLKWRDVTCLGKPGSVTPIKK